MKTEEIEKNENAVEENEDMNEEMDNKKRIRVRESILTILLLILLLVFLCFKVGNIGFKENFFSEVDKISLTDTNMQIDKEARLDIFGRKDATKEQIIDGYRVIAPGSSGTYKFSIKNTTESNMVYDIKFEDMMTSYVNMKYRLKIDNIYIKGSDTEYVDLSDLNVSNIIVPKNSTNIYTLEWCWVSDNEKDMEIANKKDRQYYTIKMEIIASAYTY